MSGKGSPTTAIYLCEWVCIKQPFGSLAFLLASSIRFNCFSLASFSSLASCSALYLAAEDEKKKEVSWVWKERRRGKGRRGGGEREGEERKEEERRGKERGRRQGGGERGGGKMEAMIIGLIKVLCNLWHSNIQTL